MHHLLPSVGGWFQDLESGVIFEVVAVDPVNETIEIQFRDGEVDEYDLDAWNGLQLQSLAEPKDWRDAYELDAEDRVVEDDVLQPENWSGILNSMEPPDTLSWVET